MISLQMGVIPNLDILNKLSDINKRKNCSEKIKKYLNAELPENEMLIDWSKARRDYDLIPWADNNDYLALWEERHAQNEYYLDDKHILGWRLT